MECRTRPSQGAVRHASRRRVRADIFGRLDAADLLRGLAREEFNTRLAEFLADVNAVHPFREGNGRTQRSFFSQLAHDAGDHIDWVRLEPARNVTASAAAHRGDLPLRAMLGQRGLLSVTVSSVMIPDLGNLRAPPTRPSARSSR
jgi:fido (protein-threonine AMPylation protein)